VLAAGEEEEEGEGGQEGVSAWRASGRERGSYLPAVVGAPLGVAVVALPAVVAEALEEGAEGEEEEEEGQGRKQGKEGAQGQQM
jgi:hypothetical protein